MWWSSNLYLMTFDDIIELYWVVSVCLSVWAVPAVRGRGVPADEWRTDVSVTWLWGGACPTWRQQEGGVWPTARLWLHLLQRLQGGLPPGGVSHGTGPAHRWSLTGELTNQGTDQLTAQYYYMWCRQVSPQNIQVQNNQHLLLLLLLRVSWWMRRRLSEGGGIEPPCSSCRSQLNAVLSVQFLLRETVRNSLNGSERVWTSLNGSERSTGVWQYNNSLYESNLVTHNIHSIRGQWGKNVSLTFPEQRVSFNIQNLDVFRDCRISVFS